MNNRERMLKGLVYDPTAGDIMGDQQACNEIMYDYNATRPSEKQKRHEILKKLLGSMGKNTYIEPPLHANWGKNTHVGDDFYANFNLTLVDDADIYIGDNVMIGPNVVIATAGHPILPSLRKKGMQFNIPVFIGNNVWIGAGALVMPGVKIGDNSVIGAGSVVTRDIPENCVAYGNPCKPRRAIGEHDRQYYFRDRKIDFEIDD
ncbi:MAG TPA: sugar O-acetyltransferase [Firmicutes bacterium]|nr:sugar O-acetyltransferase [Bacillota bacterium]